MMVYSWKDLGAVTEPGFHALRDLGVVSITREDIHRARDLGGNPTLILEDLLQRKGNERTLGIRFMRP